MPNNIELIAKTVATLMTVASAITLSWKGRTKWEPSEEDLPKGAQKIVGLLIAVLVTILWVVFFDIKYFQFLIKVIAYLVVATLISFLGYGILISVFTYKGKGGAKIIGGFKLKPKAIEYKNSGIETIQEIFRKLNYDVDKTWTRLSRSLSKTVFSITYIFLIISGTLAISTSAVIFIINANKKDAVDIPVEREILNIGIVLNGVASYNQEAMEGFKQKLDSILSTTTYEAHYEFVTGFAERTKEQENIAVIKSLIEKFSANPDYILTIGTEVTKVAKKAFINEIPIIFTAVSYPIEDSIVTSYDPDPNRGNIAGVAYNDPAKILTDFLKVNFPKKRFGFLFNSSYMQDMSMYNKLVKLAKDSSVKLSLIETDTTKLTTDQLNKADIFFGRYFLLLHLREFLNNNNRAFIGNDLMFVKQGALACIATPPRELGGLAAEKVLFPNLIQSISLSDIPIILHKNPSMSFNLKAARKYNITIPKELIAKAKLVVK